MRYAIYVCNFMKGYIALYLCPVTRLLSCCHCLVLQKTTKRGRKAKCTGVKKKAQPGVSVKKKKRGRPRKVPAPVSVIK